eukprot:475657_1
MLYLVSLFIVLILGIYISCSRRRLRRFKSIPDLSTQQKHENENKKVIIMGGGIAGLTTAYRLRKAGFNVTVYEKLRHCGGLAVCTKVKHNSYGDIYIENEWHVIAGTYSNMLFLMKEIGILNNLKSVKNYLFCNKQTIIHETDYCPGCKFNIISIIKFGLKFIGWKNIKIYDIYLIIKFYLLTIMISDERRISELDEISIGDYLTNASIKVKQLYIGLLSICCGLNE